MTPWAAPAWTPIAEAPARVDVVVVGAGFAGLFAARALARGGASVAWLDGGPPGASRCASGVAVPGLVEHPWRLAASIGDARAGLLWELGRQGAAALVELGAAPGAVWAALDDREPAELDRTADLLERLGVGLSRLAPRQAPGATGAAVGAALSLPDGATYDPGALVAALVADVRAAGADVFAAEVLAIDDDGDAVARHAGGEVRAEAAVIAAGARCGALVPQLGDQVLSVREQGLWVAASLRTGVRAQLGYVHAAPAAGGVAVSGCRWATPTMEVGETDPVVVPRVQDRLQAMTARLLPDAPSPAHRWAWLAASTCDGLPLVGPLPGHRRLVVATGFGGADAALAPACGHAVADGLLHGHAGPAHDLLSPARMS